MVCHINLVICVVIGVHNFPTGNYMFKVNNKNTITSCEICSKLTIKTPKHYY